MWPRLAVFNFDMFGRKSWDSVKVNGTQQSCPQLSCMLSSCPTECYISVLLQFKFIILTDKGTSFHPPSGYFQSAHTQCRGQPLCWPASVGPLCVSWTRQHTHLYGCLCNTSTASAKLRWQIPEAEKQNEFPGTKKNSYKRTLLALCRYRLYWSSGPMSWGHNFLSRNSPKNMRKCATSHLVFVYNSNAIFTHTQIKWLCSKCECSNVGTSASTSLWHNISSETEEQIFPQFCGWDDHERLDNKVKELLWICGEGKHFTNVMKSHLSSILQQHSWE